MTKPKTPTPKRKVRSVPKYEFVTILIAVIGIGITLGTLLLTTTGRIEARLDSAIAEAAADRRASDAKMDEFRNRMDDFRNHMQRLGERQARLEGQREGGAAR